MRLYLLDQYVPVKATRSVAFVSKSEELPENGHEQKKAGPGQKEKPGHKYVSRKWNQQAGTWEYEYSHEAHPTQHGLGNVGKDEHSLEVPSADLEGKPVSSATHTPEQAYKTSRKVGAHTPGIHRSAHPVTGEPIDYVVHKPSEINGELKPYITIRKPLETPTVNEGDVPRRGRPKAFGDPVATTGKADKNQAAKRFESWAAVEHWNKLLPYIKTFGNGLVSLFPNFGKIDNTTDEFKKKPTSSSRTYRVSLGENHTAFLKKKEGGKPVDNGFYRRRPEKAAQLAIKLVRNNQRILESSDPNSQRRNAYDLFKEGQSPTAILQSDSAKFVPSTNRKAKSEIQLHFDTPEQRTEFFKQLLEEHKQVIVDKIKEASELAGGSTDSENIDYMSGINRALDIYDPTPNPYASSGEANGPSLDNFIAGRIMVTWVSAYYKKRRKDWSHKVMASGKGEDAGASPGTVLEDKVAAAIAKDPSLKDYVEQDPQVLDSNKELAAKLGEDTSENDDYAEETGMSAAAGNKVGAEDADLIADLQENQYQYVNKWKLEQEAKLDDFVEAHPENKKLQVFAERFANEHLPNVESYKDVGQITTGLEDAANVIFPGDNKLKQEFLNNVIYRDPKFRVLFGKSLEALMWVISKEPLEKSLSSLNYSHKEGTPDHPVFQYKDTVGNYVRGTNAPKGHEDEDKTASEVDLHYNEPEFSTNPEFFTPDGRKLTRAPHSNSQVDWNPNYHPNDSKNLWAGRWVNPTTGAQEFTYIDSDIRNQAKFKINRQNALLDACIPRFRQYASALFHSPQPKDQVVGLMLMLLDQGRCRAHDLEYIMPCDIQFAGDIVNIKNRLIHVDSKVQHMLSTIIGSRDPNSFVFSVYKMGDDNTPNPAYIRRIGAHYLIRLLDELGTPLEAFQTYHATQTYSQEMFRLVEGKNVTFDVAHRFALIEVAQEMGLDLSLVNDVEGALQLIEQNMIDPIVVEVVFKAVNNRQVDNSVNYLYNRSYPSIPTINAMLMDRTDSEKDFSSFLHTYPFHEHAEPADWEQTEAA